MTGTGTTGRWVEAGSAAELAAHGHAIVHLNDRYLALYHVAGEYYAIDDECSHDGGSLDGAEVDGLEVVCPRHGARFCLKTGAALSPPAYTAVGTYAVRVEDGRLLVLLP